MSQPTCTHDPKHLVHYDGALGYEAYVCRQCGTYFDYTEGEHPPDEWSRAFVSSCPVPPCPEGVPYDNHLVDCNCD